MKRFILFVAVAVALFLTVRSLVGQDAALARARALLAKVPLTSRNLLVAICFVRFERRRLRPPVSRRNGPPSTATIEAVDGRKARNQ